MRSAKELSNAYNEPDDGKFFSKFPPANKFEDHDKQETTDQKNEYPNA